MATLWKELKNDELECELWRADITVPAHVGIIRSHKQIVAWARRFHRKRVLIAEDDFYFPAGKRGVEYYFAHTPTDYDIYLAGIYVGRDKLKESREVKQFSGLHFYMVNERFYDRFLEIDETQSLDNQLSSLAILGLAKIYCLYPMAAIQHENISSTSGCIFKHDLYFDSNNVYGLH